jgi:hypothetical protein
MELIEFEEHSTVRVKFASTRGRRLVSDANVEYTGLVPAGEGSRAEWFPPGWTVAETGNVLTLTDHSQRAWRVASADGEIALVQHETGIEILVAIGTNIVAAPIIAFIARLWQEWQERRRRSLQSRANVPGGPGADTLVVETTGHAPAGTRLQRRRVVPAAELTDAQFQQILEEELRPDETPGPAPPASLLAFPIPDPVAGYVLLAAGAALVGLATWRADEPAVAPIFALLGAAMLILSAFFIRARR